MAVAMAGTSVMICESRERTGTRIFGLMRRKSSGKTCSASTFMAMSENERPVSRRRMCGQRELEPGAL